MYRQELNKPDGRRLILYARHPLPAMEAPSPIAPSNPSVHLRWHPLRGEWVAYALHRQHRTFLPSAAHNPLVPSRDPQNPSEVPEGPWDVAVFENRFPTFAATAGPPPALMVPTASGRGACEVVVFTQDPAATLGSLPLWHIALLIDVWAHRYDELGAREDVDYVYPFENRGVEVGVTLHHPHGQIYAYPFVPPVAARELECQDSYLTEHGRGLMVDLIAREVADQARLIYEGPYAVAFMPVFARYAYEVWIAPRRGIPSLSAMNAAERNDTARALKTVLLKFDGVWQRPFPYIMAIHQAPTDGRAHPGAHVHFELYPSLRMPDRIKYLAGSEIGAGVFTADTVPEEKARELQAVAVEIDV